MLDYFTPHDQQANERRATSTWDQAACCCSPTSPGLHPHEAITAGKNGTIYLVDRDNMGHYNPNNDTQIVQTIVNIFPHGTFTNGNFKAPVYWNGNLYFSADADVMKSFSLVNGMMSTTPTSQTSTVMNYPGATLSVSANGNTNGIVWASQRIDLDSERRRRPRTRHPPRLRRQQPRDRAVQQQSGARFPRPTGLHREVVFTDRRERPCVRRVAVPTDHLRPPALRWVTPRLPAPNRRSGVVGSEPHGSTGGTGRVDHADRGKMRHT